MEQIRSFIAIELPDDLKLGLAQLQARLKLSQQPWVKPVEPHNIHLTLKFLGNIEENRISAITKGIATAVRGISPFHLEVKELGAFPNLKRVQVVWVGISGEIDKLVQLQQRIESNIAPLGFPGEARSFTPHLTIARLRNQATLDERQRLGELIAATKFEVAYTIEVETIHLMRSQLTREGPIYSRIGSVGLDKPLPTAST